MAKRLTLRWEAAESRVSPRSGAAGKPEHEDEELLLRNQAEWKALFGWKNFRLPNFLHPTPEANPNPNPNPKSSS